MSSRGLTEGEKTMLASVFASYINYTATKVFDEKWMFFQPADTTMTPNGSMYWNPTHYRADFSLHTVPLSDRAWFIHEGAHLYQHYHLKWNVIARGAVDRAYSYSLTPGKTFDSYGLEQMGDIASDYFTLANFGTIRKPYALSDYASVLPLK